MSHQVNRASRQIRSLMEQYARADGEPVRGREMLKIILDGFRASDNSDSTFGFDHLAGLKYSDDNREEFLSTWLHMVENIKDSNGLVSNVVFRDVMYREIQDSQVLRMPLYDYGVKKQKGEEVTYEFLVDAFLAQGCGDP